MESTKAFQERQNSTAKLKSASKDVMSRMNPAENWQWCTGQTWGVPPEHVKKDQRENDEAEYNKFDYKNYTYS